MPMRPSMTTSQWHSNDSSTPTTNGFTRVKDLVMLNVPAHAPLQPKWTGPWVVRKVKLPNVIIMKPGEPSTRQLVHVERLKIYKKHEDPTFRRTTRASNASQRSTQATPTSRND